jgi:hypothetical protein
MPASAAALPDPFDGSLTNPASVEVLRARPIPGGHTEVRGHATFRGVRVDVYLVNYDGRVYIGGDLPKKGVYRRDDDPRLEGVTGMVDFRALDRFWLTRTTTYDVIDESTPQPGVTTRVDGRDFAVADTCGTVSEAGVPQLQLIGPGAGEPTADLVAGAAWTPDGYGAYTALVDRSRASAVRQVTWQAVWRDFTVTVAGIREGLALVYVPTGGVPDFDVPEITIVEDNLNSGWSALVPVEQLSLRSWTRVDRPVGSGTTAGFVGRVRGRYALVSRPAVPRPKPGEAPVAAAGTGFVADKGQGESVTDDFFLFPCTSGYDSYWEWRAHLDANEVTDLTQVSATTTWRGETYAVEGCNDETAQVYLNRSAVDVLETTPLVYSVRRVERSELPVARVPSWPYGPEGPRKRMSTAY